MGWSRKRHSVRMFTIVAEASLSRQRLAKVLCTGKHRADSSGRTEENSVMVRRMVFCPLLVTNSGADTPNKADTPRGPGYAQHVELI